MHTKKIMLDCFKLVQQAGFILFLSSHPLIQLEAERSALQEDRRVSEASCAALREQRDALELEVSQLQTERAGLDRRSREMDEKQQRTEEQLHSVRRERAKLKEQLVQVRWPQSHRCTDISANATELLLKKNVNF